MHAIEKYHCTNVTVMLQSICEMISSAALWVSYTILSALVFSVSSVYNLSLSY